MPTLSEKDYTFNKCSESRVIGWKMREEPFTFFQLLVKSSIKGEYTSTQLERSENNVTPVTITNQV